VRANLEIRPAVIADAPGIADVHWRSHQTTYVEPGRVPRTTVEAWTMRDRIQVWTTNLAIASAAYPPPSGFRRMALWVAEDDGAVVGFSATSGGHRGDGPRDLELHALYVLDEYHGTGVGQGLLDAALGAEPAYLWVLGDNPRARAFYGRNGFVPDGTEKLDEDWDVNVVRLVR